MGWTKGQFIRMAYSTLGLRQSDVDAEANENALTVLDSMLAAWLRNPGVHLGWVFPASPSDSSASTVTNVPDDANEAIYLHLAKRLAPSVGKALPMNAEAAAARAYAAICAAYLPLGEVRRPNWLPVGAGNKPISTLQSEFFPEPDLDQVARTNQIEGNR